LAVVVDNHFTQNLHLPDIPAVSGPAVILLIWTFSNRLQQDFGHFLQPPLLRYDLVQIVRSVQCIAFEDYHG
jgi:hypothetical protein